MTTIKELCEKLDIDPTSFNDEDSKVIKLMTHYVKNHNKKIKQYFNEKEDEEDIKMKCVYNNTFKKWEPISK